MTANLKWALLLLSYQASPFLLLLCPQTSISAPILTLNRSILPTPLRKLNQKNFHKLLPTSVHSASPLVPLVEGFMLLTRPTLSLVCDISHLSSTQSHPPVLPPLLSRFNLSYLTNNFHHTQILLFLLSLKNFLSFFLSFLNPLPFQLYPISLLPFIANVSIS